MKSRIFLLVATMVCASLLLGACNMPTSTPAFIPPVGVPNLSPPIRVADNNVIWLEGSPIIAPPDTARTIRVIVATDQAWHGVGYGPTGLSSVNISSGGSRIGTLALDPTQYHSVGSMQWTPPSSPGEYTIQAAPSGGAPNLNQISILALTFCVDDRGITVLDDNRGEEHPCALLPNPDVTPPFQITSTNATATADCSRVDVEFDITVDDPARRVFEGFVELLNVAQEFQFGMLLHGFLIPRPGPAGSYSTVLSWPTQDLMQQLAGSDTITWMAGASGLPEYGLYTDGPHQVRIRWPNCLAFPTLSVPVIPRIPSLLPALPLPQPLNAIQTDTPTVTATIAPNTPIPTKRPPACKKYKDEGSCGAASCHWDSKTSTCGEP